MKKSHLNFYIDVLLYIDMVVIAAIGLLVKYNLITGEERRARFGINVDQSLWGMDRHQWGHIHLLLGYLFLALTVLHIVLHWRVILRIFRQLVGSSAWRKALSLILFLFTLLLLAAPFALQPEIDWLSGRGRGHGEASAPPLPAERTDPAPDRSDAAAPKARDRLAKSSYSAHEEHEQNNEPRLGVTGQMTVTEAAGRFGISPTALLRELGLPEDTPAHSRLGRLRRSYGFTMSEVDRVIQKLQHQ